jgi:hypothetical protein
MSERALGEVRPSELLLLIGAGKHGIPKDSTRLSVEVMMPRVTDALKSYGIAAERRRSNGKRFLHLKSITP